MSRWVSGALLGTMILSMAGAQVLYKRAGLHTGQGLLLGLLLNPWLWAGLFASACGFASWFLALRRMPLSTAYPWTALVYLITPVAGVVCFHEPLNAGMALGIGLVVTGLFIISRGAPADVAA